MSLLATSLNRSSPALASLPDDEELAEEDDVEDEEDDDFVLFARLAMQPLVSNSNAISASGSNSQHLPTPRISDKN